jgi:glycosyltransferase involved in cell wall biosynthesis
MPSVSVIVPAYNRSRELRECLSALSRSVPPPLESIVVDDASTDDTSSVATEHGAIVLRLARNAGPAAARNAGGRAAQGDIVLFVDSDVVVAPEAIRRVVKAFEDDPALAAVFGSYDRRPRAPGLVSRYRNLLHHYTHQIGNPEAGTFWSGCGAIRRSVFVGVGGFDAARSPRPSIEDSNWAIACASQVIGSGWIGRFREPTSGGGDCGLSTEPTSPAAPYPWRD